MELLIFKILFGHELKVVNFFLILIGLVVKK